MRYFIMIQDKRVLNAVQADNLTGIIDKKMISKENYRDIGDDILQCSIKNDSRVEYVDFIQYPLPLISEKLKDLILLYDKGIILRPVVLLDKSRSKQKLYYIIAPNFKNCLSERSEFNKDGSIKKLVINEKKIGYCSIFRIDRILEDFIVVRLDLAESILRRNFTGIRFKKIDKEDLDGKNK